MFKFGGLGLFLVYSKLELFLYGSELFLMR